MALALYNTLKRAKEPFTPAKPGQVTLYTCGPTVYDSQHIGNLRTAVFNDTLRRWLRYGHGLKVKQVQNITDVEDKIITRSDAKTVEGMKAWTKQFEDKYAADLASLGVEAADVIPHATDYVPQMIAFIERIIKEKLAYVRDGSVYLDVAAYHAKHGYGKLLNIDTANFGKVSRLEADEYDKDDAQDFALWKAEDAGKPGWDSPWGYGRPGWHLECSVMVDETLGEPIDIHTGGVDLIFPHHENEIAQTKAATGKDLATTWVHAEHLLVDSAKMAKSAGNFYVLDDVTAKGYDPTVLRLAYLGAHYRSKPNFSWDALEAAKASYGRLQEFLLRLSEEKTGADADASTVADLVAKAREDFTTAMDDDLNTPEALAAVFELIREVNALDADDKLDEGGVQVVKEAFDFFHQAFGVFALEEVTIPQNVQKLVEKRQKARDMRDFDASDRLRDEISALGWEVEDTATGQRVRKS